MKLSKHLRYLVRVRDYETVQVEIGAEISVYDIGFTDASWACEEPEDREMYTNEMHDLLNQEVDRLARAELETIGEWSEISPNLAEDYLSEKPPTTMQRKPHATTTDKTATSSRTIRRGGAATSPASRPA